MSLSLSSSLPSLEIFDTGKIGRKYCFSITIGLDHFGFVEDDSCIDAFFILSYTVCRDGVAVLVVDGEF